MRARRDADVCTNPVKGRVDVGELNHFAGAERLLEAPECSSADKVIVLASVAGGRQRKVRLAGPEVPHPAANAKLFPDLDIQSKPGLFVLSNRRERKYCCHSH